MNVLWVCNLMPKYVAKRINLKINVFGGWLDGLLSSLVGKKNMKLSVSFPYNKNLRGEAGSVEYYSFCRDGLRLRLEEIVLLVKPDIIHIFGTEFKHTYEMVEVCKKLGIADRVLISIQGLVSLYAEVFTLGIPFFYKHFLTIKDIVRKTGILDGKKNFQKRGFWEIQALQNVNWVTGRTDWDRACVLRINPCVEYELCNESLRDAFYLNNKKWNLDKCKRHSIFVSQCSYPIKGFHNLLKVFKEVLQKYPDAVIYTTGTSPIKKLLKERFKQSSYDVYLAKLIKKNGLEDKIKFLGFLQEEEMRDAFCNCHVFVSPSNAENSPNSLGEAMLLGVPCVSSDVGGVKNMMMHRVEGFVYPLQEPYMLAYYICELFGNDNLAKFYSDNAKLRAEKTHDRENNSKRMLEIYDKIIKL